MRSAERKNMSRPKISDARNRQLNLRLTRSELESIERRAEALGMRPVHFGRAILLGTTAKLVVHRETNDRPTRLIYGQLSRLGNLLNQMVRHLHQTGDPLPPDLEPLLKDIREIIARRVSL
jgi:hypothetical protein